MKKIIVLFFILIPLAGFCQEQDTLSYTPLYRKGIKYTLKTTVGTSYTGFLVEETKDFVTLQDRNTREKFELRKSEIVSGNRTPELKNFREEILGENPHARNYMLANSAFLFEEGKLNTNSHWLLFENIDFAFTDNWAVSVNTLGFYPFSVGAKCAFEVGDDYFIGASAFGVGDITSSGNNSALLGYGGVVRVTKGTSNNNITVSGGVLGLNSDFFLGISTVPYVNIGFVNAAYCNRLSKRVALNLEGWYLPEAQMGIAGAGIKLIGDETMCWSFGCYTLLNTYNNTLNVNLKTIPIPYIGITRKFN